MSVAAAFFYLFSGVAVASAFMVIASRNPVHSVLFLILCFVNAAGLFLMVLRPFKVGDMISAAGVTGDVRRLAERFTDFMGQRTGTSWAKIRD
jgi:hypothetical protein